MRKLETITDNKHVHENKRHNVLQRESVIFEEMNCLTETDLDRGQLQGLKYIESIKEAFSQHTIYTELQNLQQGRI